MENHHFQWLNPLFLLCHFQVRKPSVITRYQKSTWSTPKSPHKSLKAPTSRVDRSPAISASSEGSPDLTSRNRDAPAALGGWFLKATCGKITIFNGKITIFNGKITIFNGKITIFNGKITIFNGKITIFNGKIHYKWVGNCPMTWE